MPFLNRENRVFACASVLQIVDVSSLAAYINLFLYKSRKSTPADL